MTRYLLFFIFLFTNFLAHAGQVDTLVVYSKSMKKEVKNIVIYPDNYSNTGTPYSVVYLLHGATDDYRFWPRDIPSIIEFADTYNLIIVCPDGGRTSWYFDSPVDETMRYETYVSSELISSIDSSYNTKRESKGRGIVGLSMGGHGAFYLAFRHQDVWGVAGSTSGGLDIRPFPNGWDLPDRLGNYDDNKQNWENNTVINMVDLLKGSSLNLIFDCGVDDFFYEGNKAFHEILLQNKFPHDYIERPGGHTLDYWANSIKYQFMYFNQYFTKK